MKKIFTSLCILFLGATLNAQTFTFGNLAVFVADASANNTTARILELSPTVPGPAINTFIIDGTTMPNSLRFSGSATSTGYLTLSDDKTLLSFTGGNTITTGVNVNTILPRGVGSFNNIGTFTLSTTYTGSSGQQTRSVTTKNNLNWFIGDQAGIYTNGSTSASPSANARAVKSFGGIVYVGSASGSLTQVSTLATPSGASLVGLPGLVTNPAHQDFYLVSSGSNGSSYDVLYTISATSNTLGTLEKFSLVGGIWVSNGTYSTGFGGFGIAAQAGSGNAVLFISEGLGALTANRMIQLVDLIGWNSPLMINTPSNLTLYTAAAGTIVKGVSFAPIQAPTIQFASAHQSVLENVGTANVTFNMTSAANLFPAKVIVTTSVHTTATGGGVDYTLSTDTVTFPAGSTVSQNLVVNINDDLLPENAEYISFKVSSTHNATMTGANQFHILYIRDNDYVAPTPTNEVMFTLLGSFSNGAEGSNSAEIVAYDSTSQKLVIANSIGRKLDFVDFSNPSLPVLLSSINITALGNINSVAARDGIVAVALENLAPQSNGKVFFYSTSGALISQVDVGAMPDMITFNHSGNKVLVACEGEPNSAYTIDPEGTIGVVDISGGVASVTNANVTMINFNTYDSQASTLRAAGVRIYGPLASVSQDFEPEYITVSDDDLKAWVVLQENNAMAVIDLLTNTVTQILPLGTANHALTSNGMDASDQSSGINIANYPVKGMYLPDGLTHINIGGTNYLITANEGDSRALGGLNEESRVSGLTLDPTVFVDQNILKSNFMLGRLNATTQAGDTDNDGDIDEIHVYGGRGFSIWTETGTLVYNSGNLLEKIIASHPTFAGLFNANHGPGAITTKNRSDDKGVEPEGVAVANIDGDNLAFVSCERLGGVFVFNIDNPASPRYVGYYNNRSIPGNNPDRGAEGILFINASASPNGNDILILANEVSSTLSIFQVNTCASLSSVNVNYTPNDTVCLGQFVTFNTTVGGSTNLQWLENNANISGQTGTSTIVTTAGYYSLAVQNTLLSCADTTAQTQIVVNALPTVGANVTDNDFCNGTSVTFTGTGASTYLWSGGVTNGTPIAPSASATYTVTGTGSNGCSNTFTVGITVHAIPTVSANVTDNDFCAGTSVTFTGSGASGYVWSGGVANGVPFAPAASATYTVTGTDAFTCSNTNTVSVTVHALPTVSANVTDNDFCAGTSVTFTASGASSYSWSGSVINGTPLAPAATATYTVTGTNSFACSNTATVSVTVHNLPSVVANVTDNNICTGSSVTFTGSGASTYLWSGSVTNGTPFAPSGTSTYTVTGTDASSCSNTATTTVVVNNLPTVTGNVTDNTICLGDAVVFTGSGASSYSWTSGVLNGSSYTPSATGTYTVTGTDVNSCSNTGTVSVTVNNLPSVNLNLLPDMYCINYSPFNIPGATPAGGNFSGTGVTGSQFDPATGLGVYTITYTYTDGNGCTNVDTDNLTVIGCTGIDETSSEELIIYPNPTENYFYIKTNITGMFDIKIMDIEGKVIYSSKVSASEMIDVSQYAAGAYIVELIQNDKIFRNRLIVK